MLDKKEKRLFLSPVTNWRLWMVFTQYDLGGYCKAESGT